jgi:DNA-binding transcriptional ArsR family regulator
MLFMRFSWHLLLAKVNDPVNNTIVASSSHVSSSAHRKASADDRLDLVFGALSDRTRRAMLARLAQGPAMVTELAQPHAVSLPAVSRHLKVLERAQLVQRNVQGRVHVCALDPAAMQDLRQWLLHYRAFWEGQLDALEQYAATHTKPHATARTTTRRKS